MKRLGLFLSFLFLCQPAYANVHFGSLTANNNLSLTAKNNIKNISAEMAARNITLVSSNGNIINRRYLETQSFAGGNDVKTVTGKAGSIEATDNLALNAGKTIAITGSKLTGGNISLKAKQVNIGTTVKTSHFNAAVSGVSLKQQSTTHLGSNIEGGNVAINTTGKTTVSGSRVHADENLNIKAGKLDVLAVNDSSYEEDRTTSKGFLSHQSTTTRHATSTNVGSSVSGGNVSLNTSKDNIEVVGSDVSADNKLALKSAKDINVQAGFDGAMDETHTKKSGFFTGGALFSKSDDLEGKLTKTAVLAKLSGKDVSLTAGKDMALKGVDVTAKESLTGRAQNITVENTNNEEKTWSKHEKLSVGFGDALKSIVQPYKAVKYKDGKASITLAKAEFSKADKVTTKTTVVGSNLQANNISLTARSGDQGESDDHHSDGHQGKVNPPGDILLLHNSPDGAAGEGTLGHKVNGAAGEGTLGHEGDDDQPDAQGGDIKITGSNLVARNEISLTAGGDVTIKEAKSTEKIASKDMKGTAELSLTVKNEYVQVGYAVNEARKSEKNLKNAKQSYTRYRRDLGKQRGKLIKLKAELANGKIGIEQADVDEMASLIDDLKGDDAFYKANMALAAADLATKTLAVASQMAKAASSGETYGFSASLELDIDALVKKFNAFAEKSVASNVNAKDININAGSTATVQGSNLNASNRIDIAANDTNILASQDVNTSSNSRKHAHLNISYGTAGGSVTASADSTKGSSRGITNHNSQLVASNINITTKDRTTIAGANVSASDTLTLKTKHLDVASVQDSQNSRSNSQGFSISGGESGVSGVGANMSMSHSRQKQTVLTTLTGNNVNINVAKDTKLKGATLAAVDKQGNDNGNLNLKTNTLEVSSLNNTRSSKSLSAGINAGIANRQQQDNSNKSTLSTVGIDFANDRANSKTKTLGTIGKGNIEVASVDKSNTKMLNRDTKDNEVSIYNIKSHKGLKGSLDTRLLTEEGRKQVRKEFRDFGKNMQIVAQGLPDSKDKQKVIAVVGEILDTVSKYTAGIVPSHGTSGGLLGNIPILAGSPDINLGASTVPGAYNGKTIYIPGILNFTLQDMQQGADNLIGKNVPRKIWKNSSHGVIGDLLESAVDILNGIGLQTGISKQVDHLQQINHDMKIYMHSQGNLVTAEGARHSKENGNTYYSFGSPMSNSAMEKAFNGKGKKLIEPYKDPKDPVSHPIPNLFIPNNWSSHTTESYRKFKQIRDKEKIINK